MGANLIFLRSSMLIVLMLMLDIFLVFLDLTQSRRSAKSLNLRRVHCYEELVLLTWL